MKKSDHIKSASSGSEMLTVQQGWPCFREHSLFESAVTEAARELQVSREMAMMCAFGAMATACQGQVNLQMPTGHPAPTSLMLLTIAESGERKTTTQNYFFDAINVLNDEEYQANEVSFRKHRINYELWETKKRHLQRMYSKCAAQEDEDATHAALEKLTEHLKTEPQPNRSGKFLYEDTTPQALVQMLYENRPNGCLLTSEASSIFSGKALGELDKLNTLWDGGSVIVDRVSREGFILRDARLTLSLMAQPSVIASFMGKRGNEARGTGFLARFLVVKPRTMAGERTHEKLSSLPRKQNFNARVREKLTFATSSSRQVLRFSEPAASLWYEYSQYLEQEMRSNGLYHYLRDHASKLLENASRLAAILHTFERTSDNDTEIDLFTLKFCWEFARACSGHFIAHLANEPQVVTDANNLAHFLLSLANKDSRIDHTRAAQDTRRYRNQVTPPETQTDNLISGVRTTFTLTKVKQYGPSSLRGRANSERLDAAIDLLTKLGHIRKEGSNYRFQETILLTPEQLTLKNGETITVKELPLFSEQQYCKPQTMDAYRVKGDYFIKVCQ
ncbi:MULTISPECIES: YfjI family protein [unclassified Pseudomonas]|uniref:YfjI family protein n=1 Tax=unclassified Pseudomonas TaxID=196821 RepID=UPI0009F23539|nr:MULTISPECIES: YfjI family protein [unclassified Pseudomonas]QOF85654.1 DUF3987 domain-containing protein [Pseudomonas sp. ADPe]